MQEVTVRKGMIYGMGGELVAYLEGRERFVEPCRQATKLDVLGCDYDFGVVSQIVNVRQRRN